MLSIFQTANQTPTKSIWREESAW